LAIIAPQWLRMISRPEWVERYGKRIEEYKLPRSESERLETAQRYGEDGLLLLSAIFTSTAEEWLRKIPAVEMLRRIWIQQYYISDEGIRWRKSEEIPPASVLINSPYDADAHYAKKRTSAWTGYKVHLTETCEPDQPHIITNVETTSASIADVEATSMIHESLEKKELLPNLHIVDAGYVDAQLLATSLQQYHIDLLGPTRSDYRWQAKAGQGFDAAHFTIDWEKQQAICPEGHTSISWIPVVHIRSKEMINDKAT
jgi:transposase